MLRRVMMARPSGDPLFPYVRALCHFEAAPDATAWPDVVVAGGWSSAGVGKIESSAARFGSTGLACGTGGGGRFSVTAPIGSADYTAETWYKPYSAGGNRQVLDLRGNTSPLGLSVYRSGADLRLQLSATTNGSLPLVIGDWHHICVERVSGVVALYVNGAVCASAVDERAYTGAGRFCVGMTYNNGQFDVADYDEFRLTVGVARYGGPFSPPTAAFPTA